jgi:HK97 gp10 family phage protein
MAKKDVIWVDGERELFLNMQRTMDGTLKAAMQGIEKAALSIIADAKDNLKGNHSVVTGQLRASGRVQRVEGDEQALDAGFFSQDTTGGYASFVKYGRRAGKMPPIQMLMEWMRKRTSKSKALQSAIIHMEGRRVRRKAAYTKDDLLRSAAWALAKWIAKKGTKPHPFFAPAVEKNKGEVEATIKTAYEQAIK